MSEEPKVVEHEDLEWNRKHWEWVMDQVAETFEREARISDGLCTISDERKAGRAEAYRACAGAVLKSSTRKMFIFPDPWIGYTPTTEASV